MENAFVFYSENEDETFKFGEALGLMAEKGDCFALYGTLGMGKSVLARGFIKELTGEKEVPSPTFTLLQVYHAPNFDIYHYDLYRIKNAEEVFELGMDEALFQGVSLIEWPEKAYLPKDIFKVAIMPKDDKRMISITSRDDKNVVRLNKFFKGLNKGGK